MSLVWVLPLFIYICVVWNRWVHSASRVPEPKWRGICGVLGLSLGSVSVLLFIYTAIWAEMKGGFPFYDPSLLLVYRAGIGLSLLGLLCGIPAQREFRKPTLISSTAIFITWLLVATGE